MSIDSDREGLLVSEAYVRMALRSFNGSEDLFHKGVYDRIERLELEERNDPLESASPFLRAAASFIPLQLLTGEKLSASVLPLAKGSTAGKLLGIVAFPAVTLFLLVGATIFGTTTIMSIQRSRAPTLDDSNAIQTASLQWWQSHKWIAILLFTLSIGVGCFGATSWMLFIYLISLAAMLYVLHCFAKLGLGNRSLVAQSVLFGLNSLGQFSSMAGMGDREIHFLDQKLLPAIFFLATMFVIPFVGQRTASSVVRSNHRATVWLVVVLLVPLLAFYSKSIWYPITYARLKTHVESFDHAPYSSVSWTRWGIVQEWASEKGFELDLSIPRKLAESEMLQSGEHSNPFIMAVLYRSGLATTGPRIQREISKSSRLLLDPAYGLNLTHGSLSQADWWIRALVQQRALTEEHVDRLERQLLASMNSLSSMNSQVIPEALNATQLLEVIGRPVDLDRLRSRIHDILREMHCKSGGGFTLAGGFKSYSASLVSSIDDTAFAVQLMQIYGIPDGLDLNWVRSYLKPIAFRGGDHETYIAALTLDRLNQLPGSTKPTWLEYLYYERSLLMAVILASLCIVAIFTSPVLEQRGTEVPNELGLT